MGKVRKLRKKYKALCSKNAVISKPSISKKNTKITALSAKRNKDPINVQSDQLVLKTKKEFLKNTSETTAKINNQKLFGVRANKNFIEGAKNSSEVVQSNEDSSLSKKQIEQKNFSRRMKNRPRKHATKIRHNNFIQDMNAFKKTLKEESFLKKPATIVMNQTLERLSAECSFNSKKKVKNVHKNRRKLC